MKRICSLFLACFLFATMGMSAYAMESPYSMVEAIDLQLKSSPIYIIGPYDINSNEGYTEVNDTETGTYYTRVRETKLIHGPADNDPVTNYKDFGIVYRTDNFSGTLSESISISDSVQKSTTVSDSVGVSLGVDVGKVKSSINYTHSESVTKSVGQTKSKSFSKGHNYGFPAQYAPENCTKAKRGVGFQYETYRSIIDIKKEVDVMKYVDIIDKKFISEEERCYICGDRPCSDPRRHEHYPLTKFKYTLADGDTVYVYDEKINDLVSQGIISPDLKKWKKKVKEWRRVEAYGTVKVPVPVMVTIYYDSDGNILDKDGKIIHQ